MKLYNIKHKILLSVISILLCAATLCGCTVFDIFEASDKGSSDSQNSTTTPSQAKPRTEAYSGYGYQSLDSADKQRIYSMIDEYANKSASEEFSLGGEYSENTITQALLAYQCDNPQVFWIDGTFEYYNSNGVTVLSLIFTIENANLINLRRELENKIDNIISSAPNDAGDYDIEFYINDYLVDNCEYDSEGATAASNGKTLGNEHNVCGALLDGKAVCDGYSKAFQLLCNRLGIECTVVEGTSKDESHMWNCVKIEGEWYHTDVTWNDSNENIYSERYFYLNLTTEDINTDHTINKTFSELDSNSYDNTVLYNSFVPECTNTEYNYFYKNNLILTDPDNADNIVTALIASAEQYEDSFAFVIDSRLDFEETFNRLANDGYIYSWVEETNSVNKNLPCISTQSPLYSYTELGFVVIKLEYL